MLYKYAGMARIPIPAITQDGGPIVYHKLGL